MSPITMFQLLIKQKISTEKTQRILKSYGGGGTPLLCYACSLKRCGWGRQMIAPQSHDSLQPQREDHLLLTMYLSYGTQQLPQGSLLLVRW